MLEDVLEVLRAHAVADVQIGYVRDAEAVEAGAAARLRDARRTVLAVVVKPPAHPAPERPIVDELPEGCLEPRHPPPEGAVRAPARR